MAKKTKERKGYFYEREEDAILQFIHEDDEVKRNKIFNTILYPALTKMIESIIRRYKLFIPDEDFDQNFRDTISYLLTKINHYRRKITGYDEITKKESLKHECVRMSEEDYKKKVRDATPDDPEYILVHFTPPHVLPAEEEYLEFIHYFKKATHYYKAYSYCGTICRNYLRYKSSQYAKKRKKNTSYDEIYDEISNDTKYSTADKSYAEVAEGLITEVTKEIENMIENPEKFMLNDDEIKVGKAIIYLFKNWEEVIPNDKDSNKMQKSSILYFLREETMMTTKEVRDNMKKYKAVFKALKNAALDE